MNAKSLDLQLSIYPQPEQELVLVQTHSVLEEHITAARRAATSTYNDARAQVQGVVDRWIGVEHAVESESSSPWCQRSTLTGSRSSKVHHSCR